MKNLLYKELRLAFHPTVALFWLLSAMLLIPSYPYYVILFYSMLGIFFVCLTGRENHDLYFTMSLPIRKRDLVRARFGFVVMIELIQLLIAVPFAILRQRMPLPGNEVGMDANIAFFGISLLLFGLYNWIFLNAYYAAPDKVGKAFAITSVVMWVLIIAAEALCHIVPFMRDRLDMPDPRFITEKLAVLAVGVLCYIALTWLALRRSEKAFEKLDL
mgnify:FL=1